MDGENDRELELVQVIPSDDESTGEGGNEFEDSDQERAGGGQPVFNHVVDGPLPDDFKWKGVFPSFYLTLDDGVQFRFAGHLLPQQLKVKCEKRARKARYGRSSSLPDKQDLVLVDGNSNVVASIERKSRAWRILLDADILQKNKMAMLELHVDSMNLPAAVGRVKVTVAVGEAMYSDIKLDDEDDAWSLDCSKQPERARHRIAIAAKIIPSPRQRISGSKSRSPAIAAIADASIGDDRDFDALSSVVDSELNQQAETEELLIMTRRELKTFLRALEYKPDLNKSPEPAPMPAGFCKGFKLHTFQLRCIDWMVDREEGLGEPIPNVLWTYKPFGFGGAWVNVVTGRFSSVQPPPVPADAVLGGGNVSEMGLGKTIEMFGLMLRRPRPPNCAYSDADTLVIVPTTLIKQWTLETTKNAPGLEEPLVIALGVDGQKLEDALALLEPASVSSRRIVIVSDATFCREDVFSRIQKLRWFRVIIDEAQMKLSSSGATNLAKLVSGPVERTVTTPCKRRACKAEDGAVSPPPEDVKVCMELVARHRWFLTGTPISQGMGDLASMATFLRGGPLKHPKIFVAALVSPVSEGRPGASEIAKRFEFLGKFMIRHSKAGVRDELRDVLQPASDRRVRVDLCDAERAIYSHKERSLLSNFNEALAVRTRLSLSDPDAVDVNPPRSKGRPLDIEQTRAKIEAAKKAAVEAAEIDYYRAVARDAQECSVRDSGLGLAHLQYATSGENQTPEDVLREVREISKERLAERKLLLEQEASNNAGEHI
eukprot:tig00020830_g14493.t1